MNRIVSNSLSVLKAHPYASASAALLLAAHSSTVLNVLDHRLVKVLSVAMILVLAKLGDYRIAIAAAAVLAVITLLKSSGKVARDAVWSSDNSTNYVKLRGHEYVDQDVVNHLPGGHGDMATNTHKLLDTQDPLAYDGPDHATIGLPHSQL